MRLRLRRRCIEDSGFDISFKYVLESSGSRYCLPSKFYFMRTTILFILLLSATFGFAQAVTIDNEPAQVEYYRMPDDPLDASYTTYSADIDIPFSQLGKTGFVESALIDQYLTLEGYKRVNSKGDVEVTAVIGDFTIWGEHRNTNRTKSKDKNGNETTKVSYNIEVRYSLPVSLQVYDKKGDRLYDRYIGGSSADTRTWTSHSYNNLSDLESYWRTSRTSRLAQLQKEMMEQKMRDLRTELNQQFGYQRISGTTRFETIGKKKHPLYETFHKNVEIIQNAFKLMSADRDLKEIKEKVKPALAFYNAQASKYKSSSKDDMRLRHICLYNQALAYFWLEDFTQSETFANEIQRMDDKDKDAKRLLQDIEETRYSLNHAGRTSRHMVSVGKT